MEHSTDIVIHINKKMDNQNRKFFSDKVQKLKGVISAKLQDKHPQLMIVGYKSSEIKAYDVVFGIRKTGMEAQLVSWL